MVKRGRRKTGLGKVDSRIGGGDAKGTVKKSIEEINAKIEKGKVVVVTAEEMKKIVEEEGVRRAAEKVDVVTTATFGPMCSSGALLNVGHSKPRIKIEEAYLNGVRVASGLAAVDLYLGATALRPDDPRNRQHPGKFEYGGGFVIEELVRGEKVQFEAYGYGTDCYPRRSVKTSLTLKSLNSAVLLNPRNAYQSYNVAVNADPKRTLYTYMGILRPNLGNANYSTTGGLSPLFNDPYLRRIGIGTRILVAGADGYVFWWGTQHRVVERTEKGIPKAPAATLATVANMKRMDATFLRGVSLTGYGVSLAVGIAIPIAILDEETARFCAVRDEDILMPVVDYSVDYPQSTGKTLGLVDYGSLRRGRVRIGGKEVETAPLSSYHKALELAQLLKERIKGGTFFLSGWVERLPSEGEDAELKALVVS
ncbi:MAG: homocysteine biosynthesis protein [Planctomycetota bacterium]|nr:homocysteine biosynthesis protein [Planctomycetota bacterium]